MFFVGAVSGSYTRRSSRQVEGIVKKQNLKTRVCTDVFEECKNRVEKNRITHMVYVKFYLDPSRYFRVTVL